MKRKGGDETRRAALNLLESRLRLFPRPGRRERLTVPSLLECERMIQDFHASPDADGLDVEPDALGFLAWNLVEFKIRHGEGDPLRWSPSLVEVLMRDFFPRKVTADIATADHLPTVLSGWIRWAGRRRGLEPQLVRATLAAVDGARRAFQRACRDRSRFMPAKAVATAMSEDGVDITDQAAVDAWVETYRSRSPRERTALLGQRLDLVGAVVDDGRLRVAVARPA